MSEENKELVSIPMPLEDLDEQIWSSILSWLNNQTDLPEFIRDLIAKRAEQLRLKIQVLVMELQRKHINDIALDVQFESELKREMRKSFPFLNPKEQADLLTVISSTNESRLKRLESQLGGFDLFSNIEFAVQTLSQPIPSTLQKQVKKMSPVKRQQLLSIIEELKSNIKKVDSDDFSESEIIIENIPE